MASFILSLLRFKKKKAPMVCAMDLAHDPSHVHTDACFIEIRPLSIVEFFQSQGCAACPPAIPLIHKAASQTPNALLLTYNVTYWDGKSQWKDTFASSSFDARQKSYNTRWSRTTLFTPQIIIDGSADGTGRTEEDLMRVMQHAVSVRDNMALVVGIETVGGMKVVIFSETTQTEAVFDVVVISYSPKLETIKVGRGPNKGKKMAHMNVVKAVTKLDNWQGGPKVVSLPDMTRMKDMQGLEHVVVLQQGMGGMIIGACKL